MPTWTLRLIAAAGFVALLSRLPALASVTDAAMFGLVAGVLALVAHFGPTVLRVLRDGSLRERLPFTLPHPGLPARIRPAHGVDA